MAVDVGRPPVEVGIAPQPPVVVQSPHGSPWRRRAIWLVAIAVVILIGLQLTAGFPEKWVISIGHWFESAENWILENDQSSPLFVYFLTPIKNGVNALFDNLVTVLLRMTWLGVITAAAAISGVLAGWRMAIVAAVGFAVIGLLGLWDASVETLALVLVAVGIALLIGIPLGIWAGRNDRVDRILRPLLDGMQTIPAFAYLIPLVLLFSIGTTTALIATVIFALPPAVRLTSLGVRGVSATTLEVASAYGSTAKQTLRKVQLPLARPSIMLGVNQTIMMALGMVVIAAVVGFKGLGREVYNGLQLLDVGEALNGGLAIVAMAIVLDRVSYAWSQRDRVLRGDKGTVIFGRRLSRGVMWSLAAAATVIAVVIGRQVLQQQEWPASWTISVAGPANSVVDWITSTFGGVTSAISDFLTTYALDPIRDVLVGVPWWMVCGGAALIAWQASRRWRLSLMSFLCLAAIGFLGMWEIAMDTLSQVIVAVTLAVTIAIPIGVLAARRNSFQRLLKPGLDAMQTMPAFVYLVPVIALFNIGRVPGVIAALVYALPPCIRLTDLGIRQVPKETIEASLAYGSTPNQMLRKVQLPLARPSILLGINQTIMMVLSVVIIAGLIGGGGLGLEVIKGLAHDEIARGMIGGICILLLAIVIDRITQAMGMTPHTMRGPVGTGGIGWWSRVKAIPVNRAGKTTENVSMEEQLRKGEG
jgi:glycine betaine/proline transport system permease protein